VCQKANPLNKPPPATLHPVPVGGLFHRWGIDLIGPLTETAKGNKYIVVATEYLTRWPEARALPDKSADSVHQFLLQLVYRFGACHVLLHDQGREFNNRLVRCDENVRCYDIGLPSSDEWVRQRNRKFYFLCKCSILNVRLQKKTTNEGYRTYRGLRAKTSYVTKLVKMTF